MAKNKKPKKYRTIRKKKTQEDPNNYQTNIFDFLGEKTGKVPFIPEYFAYGVDFLEPEVAERLMNSPFKDLRVVYNHLSKFRVPVYVLPDYPDKIFTRALIYNKELLDIGLISTDLTYLSVQTDVTNHVRLWERTGFNPLDPDGEEDLKLDLVDGTTYTTHPIEIALMSFWGVGPVDDPILETVDDVNKWGSVSSLDKASLLHFENNPLYLLKDLEHTDGVGSEDELEVVVETREEPETSKEEPVEVPTPQPAIPDSPDPLIPLDAYGLKEGYWYNPDTKQVLTATGNLIDDHKLKRTGIIVLETVHSTPTKLALAEILLSDIHEVCYQGKKLLPSLQYNPVLKGESETRVDYYAPPLTLTEEMKEKIRNLDGGDNRQAAAVVFGKGVTPAHTKVVKAYRKLLAEEAE